MYKYAESVDIEDDRHPVRKIITGLAVGSLFSSIAAGVAYVLEGEVAFIGTSIVLFFYGAYLWYTTPPVMLRLGSEDHASVSDDVYCSDCGKAYTTRQRQVGFNAKTGKPRFESTKGCPDGDPSAFLPYTGSSSLFATWSGIPMPVWPRCGKMATGAFSAPKHTGHGIGEVSTECTACVDQMVSDGVIDGATARKLLA